MLPIGNMHCPMAQHKAALGSLCMECEEHRNQQGSHIKQYPRSPTLSCWLSAVTHPEREIYITYCTIFTTAKTVHM